MESGMVFITEPHPLTPHKIQASLVHQDAKKWGGPCRDEVDQAVEDVGL